MQCAPIFTGEDQAARNSCLTQYLPRGPLLVSVLAQNLGGVAIQGDDACSAFGLGCAAFSRPAQLHDLLADGDGAPGKVDIGPGKADCLVSAQAPKRHQVEERIEAPLSVKRGLWYPCGGA